MARRPTINSAELIEEVKKHPCLYDNRGVHGNHEVKNAAWGDIGANMFEDEWSEFTPQEKDTMVKDLQVKWKNLRDNFSRQTRLIEQAKAGSGSFPNKKYVFMDQLSFLTHFINKREKFIMPAEDSKDSSDSMFEDQKPFKDISMSDSNDATSLSQAKIHFVPIQPKPTITTTTTFKPIDINSFTVNSVHSDEPPSKRLAVCMEELVTMQKEDRAEDPMGNKKFLLSLLPFMKKLPDDVNLEVRLQLMSVLQTYSGGKGLLS